MSRKPLFYLRRPFSPVSFCSVSLIGFIKGNWRKAMGARQRKQALREPAPADFYAADWEKSLGDPTGFYLACYRFFHQRLPRELTEHREYFRSRGFGEDAFHVLWHLLFREFRPKNFLEIGVFRGQTLSLAALLSRVNGAACEVQGISPFSTAGDSVSRYQPGVDYYDDTLRNFSHFNLPAPKLLRAYSTDPEARALIAGKAWDVIYIDGNHDSNVARQDREARAA